MSSSSISSSQFPSQQPPPPPSKGNQGGGGGGAGLQDPRARHLHTDPYLNIVNYYPKGTNLKLKDNTEFYAAGSTQSKHGVIIIPDTWGWNTGRIRNICDFLGDHEFFAVIPNFSSKGIEGEHQSFMESASVMDWYKSRTFDGNIKPTIQSVVNFMNNEGIEKISLLGFSWGSWVVASLLASDLSEEFQCGALSSPSMDMEEKMYGGSLAELMSRINRPVLLMPNKGDATSYTAFLKLMKYKLPSCKVVDFHDTEANFMLRGNSDNEHVRSALDRALNEINCFFKENANKSRDELVRQSEELGPEAITKGDRTWGEYFSQTGEQVREGVGRTEQRVGQGLKNVGERVGEGTKQAGERIGEGTKQTGQRIEDTSRGDKSPKTNK